MSNHNELFEHINRSVVWVMLLIMAVEFVGALLVQQWLTAFLITIIMSIITLPFLFRNKLPVKIPIEFHVLIILFIFATLFLGEIQSFYQKFWWWDAALHTMSGLLLGVIGLLLVYILNSSDHIDVHLRPRFVALFAFLFAVTVGVVWEIFEFAMDQWFGTNMQKPMFDDPSGLTDTMWDLILDGLGALVTVVFGWWYLRREYQSFIESWISQFVSKNPGLFRRNNKK